LDLAHLSREELERVITERCSQFGSVSSAVIVQGDHYTFALASVEMSTQAETMEVLRNLGYALVDGTAMIRIEQQAGD
jgi:hypothetical protein